MTNWDFQVMLNREPDAAEFDRLHEAGIDDCALVGGTQPYFMCDREADSLLEAIMSVLIQMSTVDKLWAVGVGHDDAVTLGDAARRHGGRTQASFRQLASGSAAPVASRLRSLRPTTSASTPGRKSPSGYVLSWVTMSRRRTGTSSWLTPRSSWPAEQVPCTGRPRCGTCWKWPAAPSGPRPRPNPGPVPSPNPSPRSSPRPNPAPSPRSELPDRCPPGGRQVRGQSRLPVPARVRVVGASGAAGRLWGRAGTSGRASRPPRPTGGRALKAGQRSWCSFSRSVNATDGVLQPPA